MNNYIVAIHDYEGIMEIYGTFNFDNAKTFFLKLWNSTPEGSTTQQEIFTFPNPDFIKEYGLSTNDFIEMVSTPDAKEDLWDSKKYLLKYRKSDELNVESPFTSEQLCLMRTGKHNRMICACSEITEILFTHH